MRHLTLTLLLLLSFHAFVSHQAFAADKPNFVWLISEDNSSHYLKLFDAHGSKTPRIEQLSGEGLLFRHAFSNSPVCSVARSTLITGCYAPRIFTHYHRRSVLAPMPDGLRMFPAYLREADYYTTNNVKKDYNAIEGPGVWDESSRRAHWRNRKAGQPFFHKQSFVTTHESSLHFTAATMNKTKTTTDPKSVFVAPYHPDTAIFRYTVARYHDRIRQVDQQIGQVVDQLREDGLLEDTFVFYFGDHGGVLPRSKGYAYESGLHVPLVVRVPKNWRHLAPWKPGSKVDGFVSFVDFGPTLLHLAGLPVPQQVDGRAFLGKDITSEEVNSRDEAFGHADRFDEKYDLVRTLRKGRYEYVRNYQPFNFDGLQNNYRYRSLAYRQWRELYQQGKLNAVQRQFFEPRAPEALYDIQADPHETNNLAGDPKYAKVLAELRDRLTERVKHLPDLSFYPESFLVDHAISNPTNFGQSHKQAIGHLVDIANLSLVPLRDARDDIDQALTSQDPTERYWGLIVCSCFGKSANSFISRAKQLASSDENLLVRTRAAEFLGLIGAVDPRPTIKDVLAKTTSGVEAGLILNTVVLLRDGKPGYEFSILADQINPAARGNDAVTRRLEYLSGRAEAGPKKGKKRHNRKK